MSNQKSWLKKETIRTLLMILIFGGILTNSCVTNKKTAYLQEYADSSYSTEYVPPEDYLIQSNDNLYLNVATPDPLQSAMFNAMTAGGGEISPASSQLYSYAVQLDGTVDLPYIGFIEVAGKTLSEAKETIETELTDYVNDATVTVKLVNNSVTVLGEVSSPGMYPLYKDRLNIYQALALAGDIDVYGDRYEVSIIRKTSEGSTVKKFDITDKNIIDSEFYYIVPNDVIYVKPMKGKFFAMATFPFGLIITSITTFILIDNYINSQ